MSQKRNLVPLTIYLSPELVAKIEKEAERNSIATATQVRMDLAGLYGKKR